MSRTSRIILVSALLGAGFGCEALAPVESGIPGGDPDGTPGKDDTALLDSDSGIDSGGTTGTSGSSGTNNPPRANAGQDKADVTPGSFITVSGNGSDLDGDPLTFLWTIEQMPTGSAAVLENDDFEEVTAYVDLPGDYILKFAVDDGTATDEDTMRITVINDNLPPVADAGFDQDACIGDTVQLSGAGSTDPELGNLLYYWQLRRAPAGSGTQLFGASSPSAAVNPYLIPDRSGLYSIELRVEDEEGLQSPADTVSITVRDCSGSSTSSSGSSGGDDCLSCAAATMDEGVAATSARFRTGGLAASYGLLFLPIMVLLYNRRR